MTYLKSIHFLHSLIEGRIEDSIKIYEETLSRIN